MPEHAENIPDCKICRGVADGSASSKSWLYRDDVWVVRASPPSAVAGWMQLQTRRHATDVSQFNDTEAATFGTMLRRVQKALLEATGAERIYTASLCEGTRHFHVHLVPKYTHMPANATGFKAFDLLGKLRAGAIEPADESQTRAILDRVGYSLASGNPKS